MTGTLIVGFSVSFTVTDCPAVLLFPCVSVIVQVTVVTPTGNRDGASFVMLATAHLSPPIVGLPRAGAAEHWPGSFETTTAAGAVIVGGGPPAAGPEANIPDASTPCA